VLGADEAVPATELVVTSRLLVVAADVVVVAPDVVVGLTVVVVAPAVVVVGFTVVVVAPVVVVGFTVVVVPYAVVVVAPEVVVVPPVVVAEASCETLTPASTKMATASSQTGLRRMTFFSCLPICLYPLLCAVALGSRAAGNQATSASGGAAQGR
jgi:hypothetical protein